MNQKISIDRYESMLLYRKYKDYLVPLAVIFACVLLFIFVLLPEFQSVFSDQANNQQQAAKLQVLQNNSRLLLGIDEKTLDQQIQTATTALPVNKDFVGILGALSFAANKTNVSLNDYEFSVGDLSNQALSGSYLTLPIDLQVNGDVNHTTAFVREILAIVPLSQITSLSLNNGSASITVAFYYKPFQQTQIAPDTPVQTQSPKDMQVLDDITKRQQQLQDNTPLSISSSSGGLTQ